MSIYSGFATRFQQQSYDHCIDSLLYLLQKRIIKFYQNEQADQQKFINLVLKLHHQMKNMEKNKYLQPKSSHSLAQLIKFMQLFLQNSSVNQDIEQERKREELPKNEPKPIILPEVNSISKKKSMFWVEKAPQPPQSNRTSSQYDKQTINKNGTTGNPQQVSISQMRKTGYRGTQLRGIKLKNASKSNLSRQQHQLDLANPPKNRSKSNYLQSKHIGLTKMTHYANSFRGENEHSDNRKNRSNQKINQGDYQTLNSPTNHNQNEVADIIKDYILKAKKNHIRASRHKDFRETSTKLHDF